VTRVAILGAGAAGVTLAAELGRAGVPTIVIEPDAGAIERARAFARGAADGLAFTVDPAAIQDAAVVIDAAEEDELPFVRAALAGMEMSARLASPRGAVLHPRATGFYLAGGKRRLVELNDEKLVPLLKRAGRVPVPVPDGPVAARLLDRLHAAADRLLLDGAVLAEVDAALVAFGFDLGPFEAEDLAGLDVGHARRRASGQTLPVADRAFGEGRIGKKIGWGWYRYPGGGGAVIDPLVEDLVREEAWFARIERRDISAEEIEERLLLALVNAAAGLIGAGAVHTVGDLDAISVAGLGFPAGRGGIASYADDIGLPRILAGLERLCAEDAAFWKPAPVLHRCVAEGRSLREARVPSRP
jgi:3-hydroxyacyl-CoA dehydrogenase